MNIEYNMINKNVIQIFGDVNGFAHKMNGKGCKYWCFSISFFQDKKLIRIAISEKDQTMHTLKNLEDRINKIVIEKY